MRPGVHVTLYTQRYTGIKLGGQVAARGMKSQSGETWLREHTLPCNPPPIWLLLITLPCSTLPDLQPWKLFPDKLVPSEDDYGHKLAIRAKIGQLKNTNSKRNPHVNIQIDIIQNSPAKTME